MQKALAIHARNHTYQIRRRVEVKKNREHPLLPEAVPRRGGLRRRVPGGHKSLSGKQSGKTRRAAGASQ